jgi:hypothetical protein
MTVAALVKPPRSIADQLRAVADGLDKGVDPRGKPVDEVERFVVVFKQKGFAAVNIEVCEGWQIDRFTLCGLLTAAADCALHGEGE